MEVAAPLMEDGLPVLCLGAFTPAPWIVFGTVASPKNGEPVPVHSQSFIARNTTDGALEVTADAIDGEEVVLSCDVTSFSLPHGGSVRLTLSWSPAAVGSMRKRAVFRFGRGRSVAMTIVGDCKQLVARKSSARFSSASVLRPPFADSTNVAASAPVVAAPPVLPCSPVEGDTRGGSSPSREAAPSLGAVEPPRVSRSRAASEDGASLTGSMCSVASALSAGIGPGAGRTRAYVGPPRPAVVAEPAAETGAAAPLPAGLDWSVQLYVGSRGSSAAPPAVAAAAPPAVVDAVPSPLVAVVAPPRPARAASGPPASFLARLALHGGAAQAVAAEVAATHSLPPRAVPAAKRARAVEAAAAVVSSPAPAPGGASLKRARSALQFSGGKCRPKLLKAEALLPTAAQGQGQEQERGRTAFKRPGAVLHGSPTIELFLPAPRRARTEAVAPETIGGGDSISITMPAQEGEADALGRSAVLLSFSPGIAMGGRPPRAAKLELDTRARKAFGLPAPAAAAASAVGAQTPAQAAGRGASEGAAMLSPRQAAKLRFGLAVTAAAPVASAAATAPVLAPRAPSQRFKHSAAAAARKGAARPSTAAAVGPASKAAAPMVGGKGGRAPLTLSISTASAAREDATLRAWLNSLLSPSVSAAAAAVPASGPLPRGATTGAIRLVAETFKEAADKLHTDARMFRLMADKTSRMQGLKVHMSGEVAGAAGALKEEVRVGRLQTRGDVAPHADTALRSRLASLLVGAYHPSWLALGLELVFGTPALSTAIAEARKAEEKEAQGRAGAVEAAPRAPPTLHRAASMQPLRRAASSQSIRAPIARGRALAPMKPAVPKAKGLQRCGSAPVLVARSGAGHDAVGGAFAAPAGGVPTPEATQAALSLLNKRFLQSVFLWDAGLAAAAVKGRRGGLGLSSPEHMAAQQSVLLRRVLTLIHFLDKARAGGEGVAAVCGVAPAAHVGAACMASCIALLAAVPVIPDAALSFLGGTDAEAEAVSGARATIAGAKATLVSAATTAGEALSRYNLPPCLFLPSSPLKSSRDVALAFMKDVSKGEGDIMRHLGVLGVSLTFTQTKVDDAAADPRKWLVSDVGADLRDGTRLIRLAELLGSLPPLALARTALRLPATSRTNKLHNVAAALACMAKQLGLDTGAAGAPGTGATRLTSARASFGRAGRTTILRVATAGAGTRGRTSIIARKGARGGLVAAVAAARRKAVGSGAGGAWATPLPVTSADLVDGRRDRTTALLWTLLDGQSVHGLPSAGKPTGVDVDALEAETARLCSASAAAAAFLQLYGARASAGQEGDGPLCASAAECALLRWVQATVAAAGASAKVRVHVTSWGGAEMADGRALALLVSRYQPRLLSRKAIALRTTSVSLRDTAGSSPTLFVCRPGTTAAAMTAALAHDRANFRLVESAASAVGLSALSIGAADAIHPPDGRAIRILAAGLARRLFETSKEGIAARRLQVWARKLHAARAEALWAKSARVRRAVCARRLQAWYRALLPGLARRQAARAAQVAQAAAVAARVEAAKAKRRDEAARRLATLTFVQRSAAATVTLCAFVARIEARFAHRSTVAAARMYLIRVATVQALIRGWRVRFRPRVNPAVWGRGRQVDGIFFRGLAITLQSFARMAAARRAVAHLRAVQASRRAAADAAQDRAAAVAALTRVNCCRRIQRCWMASCLAAEARTAATVIQALWRGFSAHRRITAVRIAVAGISRLRFVQLAARHAKTATPVQIWVATKLQAWGRMLAARRMLARSRLAAVLIQARFRAYALRRDFEWYKGACLTIQGAWRAYGARRRAAKVAAGEAARLATGIKAITRLQAVWHGRSERNAVAAVLQATTGVVTALQALWRGVLGRRAAGALHRQTELQRELTSAAAAATVAPVQDVYRPLRQARRVVERAPVSCSPQVDAIAVLALAVTSRGAEASAAARQAAYEAQLLASSAASEVAAEEEGLRAARESAALVIARACRRAFAPMSADREAYLTKRGFAMLLQTLVRGWMARRHVAVLRTSLPLAPAPFVPYALAPAPFAACLSRVVEEGEGDVSLAASFASAVPAPAPVVVAAELRMPTPAEREAAARTVQASWAAFKAARAAADAAMAAARHAARVAAGGATITAWVRMFMCSARRIRLAERVRAAVHEARRRATLAQRLAGILAAQTADTAAARAAVRAAAEAKAAAQLATAGQAIWVGGAQAAAFAASRSAVRTTASRGAAEAAMVAAARAAARSARRESAAAAAALGATMTTARAAKREASSKAAAAAAEGFGGPRKQQQWSVASPRSRMLAAQGAKAPRSTAIPPRKEAGQAAAAAALLFAARRTATSAAVQAAVWTDRRRFYDAARAIQTAWRACQSRMVASIRRGSVVLLQSWVRGAKARSVVRVAAIEAAAAAAEGEAEAEQCVGHAMQRSREAAEAELLSSPPPPSPAAPSSWAADELETVADVCAPARAERADEEADLMTEVYALAARIVQRKWRSVLRGDAPDVASALAHARRVRAGRARLAALVRGATTRARQLAVRPTLSIVHVRMRLAVATRDRARGHTRTLGARTASALASVAATRSLADVMAACEDLEVATRLSPTCARALIAVNAAPTLYAVMNACGRATAHAQLIRRILAVLRNVAAQTGADKRPLARSLATADACSTVLAVMAAHSDALPVLRPALDLLTTLLEAHPERRAAAVLAVAPVAQIRNLRGAYAKKAALVAAATGGAAPSAEAARVLAGVESGREGYSLPGTLRELDKLLAVLSRPPPVTAAAAVAARPAVPVSVPAAAALPLSPRPVNADGGRTIAKGAGAAAVAGTRLPAHSS